MDVTVVTPTIPPRTRRGGLLEHAARSVQSQTLQPADHIIVIDEERAGAAVTRQRGLDRVETEWVAFLDDDDTLYPHHLQVLTDLARERDADYAWAWFDGNNPFPMHRGRQMNVLEPHHTTMTVMVRTELARAAGFYLEKPLHQDWFGEDWHFTLRCIEILRERYGDEGASARFAGSPEVTWTYRVHGRNTSGLPSRW